MIVPICSRVDYPDNTGQEKVIQLGPSGRFPVSTATYGQYARLTSNPYGDSKWIEPGAENDKLSSCLENRRSRADQEGHAFNANVQEE